MLTRNVPLKPGPSLRRVSKQQAKTKRELGKAYKVVDADAKKLSQQIIGYKATIRQLNKTEGEGMKKKQKKSLQCRLDESQCLVGKLTARVKELEELLARLS